MRPLTIAIGNYGLTRALKEGGAAAAGFALEFVEVEPITAAMRRMVRGLEFDICEMAFTTYLCAKSLGKRVTAIPVFLTRGFHHRAAFYNPASGIKGPKDLEGRRVGVNRGYTVTTGLWARGILAREYGVRLDRVAWLPTDDEHVAEYRAPANVDYRLRGRPIVELLRAGEIDAAVGDLRSDAPEVRPLIPDARAAGVASFRRTGIYPINHAVVVQDALLAEAPSLAPALCRAFAAAKAAWRARLEAGRDLTPADEAALALRPAVGDPYPFGVAANRAALAAIVEMALEQQVIPRQFSPEELFAPGTLDFA